METNDKIKKLAEKIHREGVEKANKEAERIIDEARKEAENIVNGAKEEAASILAGAKKQAEDFSQRMESEIRLSSQQALLNLKKEIGELIQAAVLKEPLKKAFNDQEFIRRLLETMVENWNPSGDDEELHVLLPEDQLAEMETYFREKSASLMNNGLRLDEYQGPGKGLEIRPNNGHYKINLTDEAFELFLKEHFKPRTLEFLYGGKS